MKKVVNAIILDNKKILLIQRREGIHKEKWAFPGGMIEKNETEEQAIKREIKEEVGLDINRIGKQIGEYIYFREDNEKTEGKSFIILNYSNKIKINKFEVKDFGWFTLEEIERLNCAPGIKEESLKALNN